MNTNIYGKTHFKTRFQFGNIVVFSDTINPIQSAEPEVDSLNLYVKISQEADTGIWLADFTDTLRGDYGDYIIESQTLNPEGILDLNNLPETIAEQGPFGDTLFEYYLIDNKLYLKLDTAINLSEVIINATNPYTNLNSNNGNNNTHNYEQKEAFVTLFISDDGAKLERAFQRIDQVQERELVLFVEKDDTTNIFGSVFRVKAGSKLHTRSIYPKGKMASLINSYAKMTMTSNVLDELIGEYFNERDDNSIFLWVLQGSYNIIKIASNVVLKTLGDTMYELSNEANTLKIPDNRWRASIDGAPNPLFNALLPGYDELTKEKAITNLVNTLTTTYIDPLAKPAKTMVLRLRKVKPVRRLLGKKLHAVYTFLEALPNTINGIIKYLLNQLKDAFELFNALLAGILNSIVDLVKSVFDILGLLFTGLHNLIHAAGTVSISKVFHLQLEALENVIGIISSAFTLDNLKAFISFQASVLVKLPKLSKAVLGKLQNISAVPSHTIGYYTGYIVGWIAQEVVLFLATAGGGTIAKGLQGVLKSYTELASTVVKTGQKVVRTIDTTVDAFLKALQTLRDWAKNIPKLLETLRIWVDELLASLQAELIASSKLLVAIDPFSPWIINIIKNTGVKKLLKAGVTFHKKERIYILKYNNIEVIDVTTQEKFITRLKNMLAKNNKQLLKYLDDLIDFNVLKEKFLGYLYSLEEVKNGKQFLGKWLTIEEEAIIKFYSGGIYLQLNEALRGISGNLSKEFLIIKNLLNKALDKLPRFTNQDELLRSTYFSESEIKRLFPENGIFTDEGFFSTTYSENALLDWMRKNPKDNTLIKIQGKNGKLIEQAAQLQTEKEVLFKSGTSFDVVGVEKTFVYQMSREYILIILKEL